ncbi:MAG: beta-glucosidase-related glycosidase, partial [Clostridiales bacterium]|nr:beta-glucosidase-related glycosidase [Clostridiales bacterium]
MNQYEKDNTAKLRKYLPECVVMLRNNGAFPLERPCRIGAFGSGVRNTVKGGTGSGEVNSRYFVTIEDALHQAGFTIANKGWSDMYSYFDDKAREDFREEIKAKAKLEKVNVISASMGAVVKQPEYDIPLDLTCDAAIYVVSRISGEGNDRLPEKGDFLLTDSEVRDILALDEAYERFMLVINAGGPVDLSPVMDVGNILVLSQLGVETGAALTDILLGRNYPSGKLATTWSMLEDYSTIGEFGSRDDTRYREGIYVGYRYFDAFGAEPLFPFGYGVGFTSFDMKTQSVTASGPEATVTAKVTNTGGFRGKEVVQVYVSCPAGKLDREVKSLAGFAKTPELQPEESAEVSITFDLRELSAFDSDASRYVLEKGDYIVLCGTDSANAKPAAVLRLAEDVTVKQVKSCTGPVDFEDCRNHKERSFDTDGVPVIDIEVSGYEPQEMPSPGRYDVLDSLSDKELAVLNMGAFDPKKITPTAVGDSSVTVAGAAGETSSLFEDRGIRRLILADGPAGVRLAKKYYEDSKGRHTIGLPIPESVVELMPEVASKIVKKAGRVPAGAEIHEQYCTAIPIATAVAQSFNTEFAELCGDIVGSEMEIYGVDIWLAPALNIHRNVRCGRNFEYYSEDPLVSGKMAAAITRGVQSHHGCGACIKHYTANNQETNRYANNSMISERALREIYLKGFDICIRESRPAAVMTSYNLVNGIHSTESRALVTDVLRGEFGFDGVVMTDWWIGNGMLLYKDSKYTIPDAALVTAAGCDLFMPGCRKDYKEIMKGLKNGT